MDFSRLVFEFGEEVSWRFGRFETGYVLEIDGNERAYDLNEVFDFMPRSRILDIISTGEMVRLQVSCACHGDAFEYRPGVLVIDIKDGPAPAHSRFEASLSSDEITPPAEAAETSNRPPTVTNVVMALDDRQSAAANIIGKLPSGGPSLDGQADLRQTLTGEIGRATTLGLVEVVSREPDSDPSALSHAQVQVRNGFEQVARSPVGDHRNRPGCLPDASFDISAWGMAQDPVTAIGLISSRTNMQDGQLQSAEALAKAYLNLGFGAEARQVLATAEEGDGSQVLREMARLIDDPSLAQGDTLRHQYSCDSAAMPWAVLAWGADQPSASFDEAILRRTFSEWPLWLRAHIAPVLSARLLDAGYEETARSVRESVLRAQQPEEKRRSEITDTLHPTEAGHVATDLPEVGLSNIASLTRRLKVAEPHDIDDEMLSAARAFAFEAKGTNSGEALLDAYVDALARVQLFDEALEELQRFTRSHKMDPTNLRQARNRLVAMMTERASDGAFVSNSATLERGWLDTDVAMAVGVRLTELGFSEQAKRFGISPGIRQDDSKLADVVPVQPVARSAQSNPVDSLRDGRQLLENSRQLRDRVQAVLASGD
ncbi:hypothetical protein [Qingshengfaniella alkalisoli]|uniref:Uncharacterized protein n=1 Tax=Qingshengfaniella alkalisoli TaxID=2599296 RepID=A0A5B8IX30_9RHOB|nr:hypothetical protein [Qingshengfaniella alkalisoli]QDY70143.1 hypothetical protein FPZ52_11255 [Qingshengfaniella alkalisoli]